MSRPSAASPSRCCAATSASAGLTLMMRERAGVAVEYLGPVHAPLSSSHVIRSCAACMSTMTRPSAFSARMKIRAAAQQRNQGRDVSLAGRDETLFAHRQRVRRGRSAAP
jgi:hypothetical protein